jgi:hypothetical protein
MALEPESEFLDDVFALTAIQRFWNSILGCAAESSE